MTDEPPEEEIRRAIAEVRHEWAKAALLIAGVEAAVAGAVTNLAIAFVPGSALGLRLVGPVTAGHLLTVAAAVGWGLAVAVRRARKSPVDRFEAANPEVHEALRTARDAVSSDRDDPVARALYADVLDRLRTTSSRDLVAWRRLVAGVVLLVAVGAATITVTGVGITLDPTGTGPAGGVGAGPGQSGTTPSPSGLQEPDEVLGDPTDVSAGDRNRSAEVDTGPGGGGDRDSELREHPDTDGGGTDVDVRRAGYTSGEEVEEADLVREYTLALEDKDE